MVYLHGVGHFHPENVIDNPFLESLDIGVDPQWILERVGISERRTVLPLDYIRHTRNRDVRGAVEAAVYSNAEAGARAARMALGRAGVSPEEVGLIVCGGSSVQFTSPAEACVVGAELGIAATAVDVNSACSSFVAALHFVCSMRPESLPDFVLVVNAESMTRTVDYSDRRSAVLFGDGSAAAVMSPRAPSRAYVAHSTLASDPSGWSKITMPATSYFQQDGAAVQTFAIKKTIEVLKELRREAEEDHARFVFVGHQANLPMLQSVCAYAGVCAEDHLYNVDVRGNCASAGAPSVLSEHWDEFQDGDRVAIAVVGAGLTWGGVLLNFGGGGS